MTTATRFQAQPAEAADAGKAVDLIYHTDPGVWDYLFRNNRASFDRFAADLWKLPGNSFSHSESSVVRDDTGTVIAMEMGYRGGDVELELRFAMRAAAMDILPNTELVPLLEQAEDIDYLAPHFRMVKPL